MLDEYILEQLGKLAGQKEKLGNELKKITAEENSENERITKLLSVDDVGKELFSPRGSNEPLKLQVGNIKKHIDDLLLREAEIQDQIETITLEEEKYREMLSEAHAREANEDPSPATENEILDEVRQHSRNTRAQEELEIVLKKLDQCIELVMSDKTQCAAELTNLRYYIKALLSKNVSRET